MKLYVKLWCPWCVSAREWLDARGYRYELIDVEATPVIQIVIPVKIST